MTIKKKAKQVGIIKFGDGLNKKAWLDKAKADGFLIRMKRGFAEIWKAVA